MRGLKGKAVIQPIGEYRVFSGEKRQSISGMDHGVSGNRPVVDHGQTYVPSRDLQEIEHFGNSSRDLEIKL